MKMTNKLSRFYLSLYVLIATNFFPIVLVSSLTSPQDVLALKAFKSSIKPSSIPSWSCLASWDFSTDPCALPRRTHFTCGVTCSPDLSRVTQLSLDPAGYSGQLTPLVSKLTSLTYLDLSGNNFYGPIPTSISSLTSLQTLILRSNSFSNSVPDSVLPYLKSLETLDLAHNSLSGYLPKTLESLVNLKRLDLSYNKLGGSLPRLPPNIQELALKANSLSGPLQGSSFNGLNNLEVIELSENSISGTLDAWFFLLPKIQQFNLSNNTLTRVNVPKPGEESVLVAADLGFNRIEGPVPENFVGYPVLSSLSLRYNRLRGAIPLAYSRKKSLRRLFLDGNYLIGKPPAGLFAGGGPVAGSLGNNCLEECPGSSQLCEPSQKPTAICKQAYGGKGKGKPRS